MDKKIMWIGGIAIVVLLFMSQGNNAKEASAAQCNLGDIKCTSATKYQKCLANGRWSGLLTKTSDIKCDGVNRQLSANTIIKGGSISVTYSLPSQTRQNYAYAFKDKILGGCTFEGGMDGSTIAGVFISQSAAQIKTIHAPNMATTCTLSGYWFDEYGLTYRFPDQKIIVKYKGGKRA